MRTQIQVLHLWEPKVYAYHSINLKPFHPPRCVFIPLAASQPNFIHYLGEVTEIYCRNSCHVRFSVVFHLFFFFFNHCWAYWMFRAGAFFHFNKISKFSLKQCVIFLEGHFFFIFNQNLGLMHDQTTNVIVIKFSSSISSDVRNEQLRKIFEL